MSRDPFESIRFKVQIADEPHSVQLDRPGCPTFIAGCSHTVRLEKEPTGVFGSTVRMSTKPRPQGSGTIAGRAFNNDKDIGLSFVVVNSSCICPTKMVDPYEITGAFAALEKGNAVLTYTDAHGLARSFIGRPLGSAVTEATADCVRVRALFNATDPIGYGPEWCDPGGVGFTGPIVDGVGSPVWTMNNHGNTEVCFWLDFSNPQLIDGPITFGLVRGEVPGVTETTFFTLPDAASKKQLPTLAKGRNRLTIREANTTGEQILTVCWREGWI